MTSWQRSRQAAFFRSVASCLVLVIVFGLVSPALADQATTPTRTAMPARTLAEAWAPYGQAAPAGSYATAAPVPPPPPEPTPVYERGSFWLSVGLALAAGVVVGVLYERRHHELDMPTTTFGAKQF
jgi:hypothetical protein